MNPTIYLSCLVVIIGSISWTARAHGDQKFQTELTRLKSIYGSDSVHQITKYRNFPELMNFYEKYSDRLQLTHKERLDANSALRRFKEEQAKQIWVDDMPPQGGFLDDLISIAIDILTETLKKATGAQN